MELSGFRRALIQWYRRKKRDLPWRLSSDPYAIWISEIMLQQTRVAAMLPFYERFITQFPTVEALAGAHEADVLVHWAGLGYYSRARNLHRAARLVVERGGEIPSSISALRTLPGIGEYTAGAISSIAFGLPHVAVDGNLMRVIARLENDPADIGHQATRRRFTDRAAELLDRKRPGDFNQAMMELGATICVPKAPRCGECPVQTFCAAYAAGRQSQLPLKLRKQAKVEANVQALLIIKRGRVLLRQRRANESPMAGFLELPVPADVPGAVLVSEAGSFCHTITHHLYRYQVHCAEWKGTAAKPLIWSSLGKLNEILLTTAAKKAFECLRKRTASADKR